MADEIDIKSSSEASAEALRKSFTGKVIEANINCDCEDCEKGREAAEEVYESDIDHIKIEPLDVHSGVQSIFSLNYNESKKSKFMVFLSHLEKLHGTSLVEETGGTLSGLMEFIEGNTYVWEDFPFTGQEHEFADGDITTVNEQASPMWMPVETKAGTEEINV